MSNHILVAEFTTTQQMHASGIEDFQLKGCMLVQYMRIELKHSKESENSASIADIQPPPENGSV